MGSVYISAFHVPGQALARILSGRDDRVVAMQAKSLTVTYARSVLARLGHTSQDSLTLVHVLVRFSGDAKAETYRTPHGDGYVIQTERLDQATRVTICEAGTSTGLKARADQTLRPSDLLLVRVTIGEQPYVMVVYSPYYQPEWFTRDAVPDQAAFVASLKGQIQKGSSLSLLPDSLATSSCRTN